MKKLDIVINCCMDCPYLSSVVYWYVCDKSQNNINKLDASAFIHKDCCLNEVNNIIKNRFEILDL